MQQALWSMKICIKNAFQRIGTVELNYSIVVKYEICKASLRVGGYNFPKSTKAEMVLSWNFHQIHFLNNIKDWWQSILGIIWN